MVPRSQLVPCLNLLAAYCLPVSPVVRQVQAVGLRVLAYPYYYSFESGRVQVVPRLLDQWPAPMVELSVGQGVVPLVSGQPY